MTDLAHVARLPKADTLAVTVTVPADGVRTTSAPSELHEFDLDAATRLDFDGKHDSVAVVPAPPTSSFTTLVMVGLPADSPVLDPLRYAAGIDIAGPANNAGGAYGYTPKGATGVIVRTLVEFVASREKKRSK